jgi:hypothetical protein
LLSLFGSIWTSSKSTGTPPYLTNNMNINTDPKLFTLYHTSLFLTSYLSLKFCNDSEQLHIFTCQEMPE